MNPLTSEWVAKAEGDFASARRELRARHDPNYDAACFHAQQCAEKYLKARLQEAKIAFPKIHDLPPLLDLILSIEPAWEVLRGPLNFLTDFSIRFRYPGDAADRTLAREAFEQVQRVRSAARASLNLSD
jgi:HEPN domain-containing protein